MKFRSQIYVPELAAEKAEENDCPPLFLLGLHLENCIRLWDP